jgi:hypothetical protein
VFKDRSLLVYETSLFYMDQSFEGIGLHPIFVTKHVTIIKSMSRGHMWEDFVPTYKLILYVLKNLAFSPYQLTCFLQVEWCEVELLVSNLL